MKISTIMRLRTSDRCKSTKCRVHLARDSLKGKADKTMIEHICIVVRKAFFCLLGTS